MANPYCLREIAQIVHGISIAMHHSHPKRGLLPAIQIPASENPASRNDHHISTTGGSARKPKLNTVNHNDV
jgi:hypothetical protein